VLASGFLPHGLFAWFARAVRPRLQGRACLLRLAADFCLGGELEADARQIMAVRPKRLARFALTIYPTQTARMPFRTPDGREASGTGTGTCECRGLTHDWAKSSRGVWVSKRRTARQRLRRTKKAVWRWGRPPRHAPLQYQDQMLGLQVWGHFRYYYYGIRGHLRLLEEGRRSAEKAWRYWRSRRRSKRAIGWEKCQQLLETSVLPTPKIVHSL
jgi:RNA-directed DNA polymerase